jgi:hypothetical protein
MSCEYLALEMNFLHSRTQSIFDLHLPPSIIVIKVGLMAYYNIQMLLINARMTCRLAAHLYSQPLELLGRSLGLY